MAPYTEKVRRALVLKGIDHEFIEPDGPVGGPEYKALNPKTGQLPVLEIDGERIPDSTEILNRLDELFPEPPLLSEDPRIAVQQRQIEDWADESFSFYFNRWRQLGAELEGEASASASGWLARSPRLRQLLDWLRAGGTWERPQTTLLRQVGERMNDLVNLLGTRAFFYSDRVSMADLSVYGMLNTLRLGAIPGAAALLAQRPTLVEFMRRVEVATGGA